MPVVLSKFFFTFSPVLSLVRLTHEAISGKFAVTVTEFKDFGLSYSAINKLYRYSGLFVSASVGYILSKRLVQDIQLDFYLKLIKMAIGLIVTFGLYALLNLLIVLNFVNFLIILFVGIIATFVYPYIFNLVVLKIRKE